MADKEHSQVETKQTNQDSNEDAGATAAQTDTNDPELDDILDSALEDFDKVKKPTQTTQVTPSEANPTQPPNPTNADPLATFEQIFAAENDAVNIQKQMAEAMKATMGEDPQLLQQLEQLAEAAAGADGTEESQKMFTNTLQETLDSLSQNAEGLQGEMSEEELLRAMSSLGLEDGAGGGDLDFMPMMQGMLKSLLSKEVLYPSLKDISEKYPGWLSANKDRLEPQEYSNYTRQHELMMRICSEFEQEADSDPEPVQQQRFATIMDLMQQMQSLGQPPKDIVGDMMPGVEFDDQGNPQLPNLSQQCSLM